MIGWFTGLGYKLWAYAAVALLLVGFGAGTVWYLLADTNAELKADRKELNSQLAKAASARVAEREVSTKRAAVRHTRAAETAASAAKDAAAIKANREWAETPLPQEVQDALK
jgi:hypothetical protein